LALEDPYRGVISILLTGVKGRAVEVFQEHLRKAVSAVQLHELIRGGIPFSVIPHLLATTTLRRDELLEAIGLNLRTMQRYQAGRKIKLNEDKSDRTWRFSALLAKAAEVFGTREEAEESLNKPALTLENKRPIELLSTTVGAQCVECLLAQMEHDVHV
jgi:putative toxin-antitoxin system antitoxin component (TIGR02293 family)